MTREKRAAGPNKLPDKAEILAFIRNQEGRVGKREIARAFQIKGAARADLKQMLKELADQGAISRRRKKLMPPGALPPVAVIEITGRDEDGELVATPLDRIREDEGPTPLINLPSRAARARSETVGVGDRVLARMTLSEETGPEGQPIYEARVIKRLDKASVRTLGILRALPGGRGRIEPTDRRNLKEYTVGPDERGNAKPGDLVSIEITGGANARRADSAAGPSRARIVETHGPVGSQRTISKIAIQAHGIPDVFSPETLAEAKRARAVSAAGREDLRPLPLITIDPVDARDHDDAVWAAPDEAADNPGGWVVLVAIADVAHYVRPGNALDLTARERGNSVYFPDLVVPMLPERISNDLCSLKAGAPRPCMAVRMVFGADGRKRGHTFMRAIMRSAAKLSYEQAQAAIDGTPDDTTGPLLEPVLKPLWSAYQALQRGRAEREPLDLELPERKVILKDDGSVDRIIVPQRLDAHRLIEEFMIQANVAAAETLEAKHSPLLYRVHDAPSKIKLDALREFLKTLDIQLPKAGTMRPAHFNRILGRVKDSELDQLVNEMVLRSQAQAEYSPANSGHFGLNLRRYAHFTSPIRRYADLIVHRALIRALGLGRDGLSDATIDALDEIGAQISAAERRAMAAERETMDRLIAHHLAGRVGALFAARVSGVTRFGLFVRLKDTGADGFIPARSLTNDYFRLDERRQALVGERTGEMHRMGDIVEVRLVEAVPLAGALRFELVSEGQYIKTRGSGRTGADKRPARRRRKGGLR